VVEVGGIIVLRGRTSDRAAAEKAATVAQTLGFSRVANLIQVADAPDDARIMRAAERELSVHRGLDGTQIVSARRTASFASAARFPTRCRRT